MLSLPPSPQHLGSSVLNFWMIIQVDIGVTRLSSDQITAILERSLLDNSKVAELNLFGVDLIDINTDLLNVVWK